MLKVLSTKVDESILEEIKIRARNEKKSVSEYVGKIIADHLSGQKRVDLIAENIMTECLQIEAMMTIQQGFLMDALAVILGRTTPENLSAEEREKMTQNRDKAKAALLEFLSKSGSSYIAGENIWGTIKAVKTAE